jgi:hypothetical protein
MTPGGERGGILGSLLGILVCGGSGGFAAWFVVSSLEIDGVMGAILAAAIGTVVATALWIVGGLLLRAAGIAR